MEGRADVPQGQEHLGGQDEHEQPRREGQVARDQTKADRHGDEGHRQARGELEREPRQEGDPQDAHGVPPVVVGHLPDAPDLTLGATEHRERGEPADHLEETPGERSEAVPLSSLHHGGGHADQRHEHGDEGQHDHEHEPRERVGDPGGRNAGGRRDHREHELREVTAEVLVEGIEPGAEQRGDPCGGEPRHAARPPLECGEQLAAEFGLHAHRPGRAGEVPEPGGAGPSGCRDDECPEQRARLWHPHAVDEPRDERRERPCEGDRGRRLHDREQAAGEEEPARRSRAADESRIEWLHDQCTAASIDARVTRLRKIQ